LKVRRKLFARLREDGSVVLMCPLEEKEALLASGDPALFTTPHYDGYGSVLVDLDRVDPVQLTELVQDAWRHRAPARLRAAHEPPTARG
ncbi:MmcQ/YjbR family DNA-binding protein, partial [Pseudonocardia sp.]|uniref:MmcQ/YjbR family DNA-binding protein n=1 Tax=Pseudonocardia sp. TaxID=60912 RepID=UPI002627A3E5